MNDCLSFANLEKNLVALTLDNGCMNNSDKDELLNQPTPPPPPQLGMLELVNCYTDLQPQKSNPFNLQNPTVESNMNNNSLPCIRINGRRVFGPPFNWVGKQPPTNFELFVKRLPKNLSETELLTIFQKYGQLYEFRLMVDFHSENRGFGYLRYTTENDTLKAMELLNHFYFSPFRTMSVEISYNKCRLFVGNIPKNLPITIIENELKHIFQDITQITIYPFESDNNLNIGQMNSNLNRGFAFIDFVNHVAAVRAKQLSSSGRLHLWSRDLKIVWARMERKINPEIDSSLKTLFVRNIDMMVNNREIYNLLSPIVNRTEIRNVSRVREIAFIDFLNREAAEVVFKQLQGFQLYGREIEVQWAIPPCENSVHALKETDFDTLLRLKCLANNWQLPIYLFGQVLATQMIQYVAVLTGNGNSDIAFFMEVSMRGYDIQSRVAEVIVSLIQLHGYMPTHSYVLKVDDDSYHILGAITSFNSAIFESAQQINVDVNIYWNEIYQLSSAVHTLVSTPRETIQSLYNLCVRGQSEYNKFTYLPLFSNNGLYIFGCVNPEYRKKPPLKYQLNNQQIILTLCEYKTQSNCIKVNPGTLTSLWNFRNVEYSAVDTTILEVKTGDDSNDFTDVYNKRNMTPIIKGNKLQYRRVNLLPIKLVQSNKSPKTNLKTNAVTFGCKI